MMPHLASWLPALLPHSPAQLSQTAWQPPLRIEIPPTHSSVCSRGRHASRGPSGLCARPWRAAWVLSQELPLVTSAPRLPRPFQLQRALHSMCPCVLHLAHWLACVWFRNVTCSHPVAAFLSWSWSPFGLSQGPLAVLDSCSSLVLLIMRGGRVS